MTVKNSTKIATLRKVFPSVVDVVLIIGGAKVAAIEHHLRRGAILVVVDNANEIEAAKKRYFGDRIFFLPLGEGKTTVTLVEAASEKLKNSARRSANIPTHLGMGALPKLAAEALRQLLRGEAFKALARQIREKIVEIGGGRAGMARVRGLCSYVGGVGAGAGQGFSARMAVEVSQLGMPVVLTGDFLGPLTFNQVSPSCYLNAAAVLPAVIHYFNDNSIEREKLVTKYAILSELPPVGEDHELRASLVALEEQALTSTQFQRHCDQYITPNSSASGSKSEFGPRGNIMLRRTDVLAVMDVSRSLFPMVAAEYAERFQDALSAVVERQVMLRDIDWKEVGSTPSLLDQQVIWELLQNHQQETLLAAFTSVPDLREQLVFLEFMDRNRISPADFVRGCRTPPASLTEAAHRLGKLMAADERLKEEADSWDGHVAFVSAQLKIQQKSLWKKYRRTKRSGRSLFRRGDAFPPFAEQAQSIQQLSLEKAVAQRRKDLANAAAKLCAEQAMLLMERLESIQLALSENHPAKDEIMTDLATIQPVDVAFAELWNGSVLSESTRAGTLGSCLETLTLKGLAELLQIKSCDYLRIAEHICCAEPVYACPFHAGQTIHTRPDSVYALPPMNAYDQKELTIAIKRLHPDAKVTFTDSMASGIAALRLDFFSMSSFEQIFAGQIRHQMLEAQDCAQSELICLADEAMYASLGISMNGKVTFAQTASTEE